MRFRCSRPLRSCRSCIAAAPPRRTFRQKTAHDRARLRQPVAQRAVAAPAEAVARRPLSGAASQPPRRTASATTCGRSTGDRPMAMLVDSEKLGSGEIVRSREDAARAHAHRQPQGHRRLRLVGRRQVDPRAARRRSLPCRTLDGSGPPADQHAADRDRLPMSQRKRAISVRFCATISCAIDPASAPNEPVTTEGKGDSSTGARPSSSPRRKWTGTPAIGGRPDDQPDRRRALRRSAGRRSSPAPRSAPTGTTTYRAALSGGRARPTSTVDLYRDRSRTAAAG